MKLAKKLVLVAAVLPLTFATASALAYGGKGGHHGKGGEGQCGGFDRKVFSQLDLTDAQKEQMKEMRQSMKSEMKTKFSENAATKASEMQTRHQKCKTSSLLIRLMLPQPTNLLLKWSLRKPSVALK